jgi:hypothetical protein
MVAEGFSTEPPTYNGLFVTHGVGGLRLKNRLLMAPLRSFAGILSLHGRLAPEERVRIQTAN